ncbi:hypothetical protein E1180_21130 [Roseibium denhamense]|nr:hypothetical protein [Roseibium denhamense]MTI08009.1 hypothetical protein [Roseibium denhamense]
MSMALRHMHCDRAYNKNKGRTMHRTHYRPLETYVPEHIQPCSKPASDLKAAIEAANLGDMWSMILTLDYGVSEVEELSVEKQDEFLNVMALLLKAYQS